MSGPLQNELPTPDVKDQRVFSSFCLALPMPRECSTNVMHTLVVPSLLKIIFDATASIKWMKMEKKIFERQAEACCLPICSSKCLLALEHSQEPGAHLLEL